MGPDTWIPPVSKKNAGQQSQCNIYVAVLIEVQIVSMQCNIFMVIQLLSIVKVFLPSLTKKERGTVALKKVILLDEGDFSAVRHKLAASFNA